MSTDGVVDSGRSRPIRVGMLCPYSLSVPGGVQAQVLGLARELRRRGVEVRVLAPCDGPPPATFVTPLGDSLPTATNGSVAPLAPDPSCQLRTIRALTDEAFDVLHLHEPFAPGPTQTALLVNTAPIVATFHAAGNTTAYRYLRRAILAASDRIALRVAVSNDARDLAQQFIGGEYDVLFNGIELEMFRAAPEHPADGPTIFFLGRHEERKGLGVLLEAMRHVPDDVRLWIGGTGPDTADLKARHASDPRLEWLGRVSDHEKLARLKGATVFCAPSLRGESFGVVLAEAMAAGTTVVASALAGYRNVATDDVDAVLVPPGDPDALGRALGSVLGDPSRRERLEEAGRRRAEELSMTRLAAEYVVRYERLLAEPLPLVERPARGLWSRMLTSAFGRHLPDPRVADDRSSS